MSKEKQDSKMRMHRMRLDSVGGEMTQVLAAMEKSQRKVPWFL